MCLLVGVFAVQVKQLMLEAFNALLPSALPKVAFCKLQLWGAALPTNSPRCKCVYDSQSRVGICGDWLSGASMQAAVLSGRALAQQMHLATLRDSSNMLDRGLDAHAHALQDSCAIGEFPTQAKTLV